MNLLILASIVLLVVIFLQIGRVSELSAKVRGEENVKDNVNRINGWLMLVFLVGFLLITFVSAVYYKNWMLGYGPLQSASEHGGSIDGTFNTTLLLTFIVFVITHVALFYFSYKYRRRLGVPAQFISHDNTLEIVWTVIPAVVMTFLVVSGLEVWNEVTADVSQDAIPSLYATGENEYIEIEAMGYQFAWNLRYPGADGLLGKRDYRLTNANNPVGQDFKDRKNFDDFHATELVLPVGKEVRVRIVSRDVLHNFYLPHFRVKMDAVPGVPTYFKFTPQTTTNDFRQGLKEYEEYNVSDPDDPEKMLWETFDYELACAELCGNGHYSMRKLVRIVSLEEYEEWVSQQSSYYFSTIRNTDLDPYRGEVLEYEKKVRKVIFNKKVEDARALADSIDRIIRFDYVTFKTGSAELTPMNTYELDFLVDAMKKYQNMRIEVAGHTDNTGDVDSNLTLSQSRSVSVFNYLVAHGVSPDRLTSAGYGQNRPIADNNTEQGRKENRRTEFKILNK